jgi:hypothetical protein
LVKSLLVEGSSLRSVSRVCDVSINTVTKLLVDAGTACAAYHDEKVRHVKANPFWDVSKEAPNHGHLHQTSYREYKRTNPQLQKPFHFSFLLFRLSSVQIQAARQSPEEIEIAMRI